VTAERSSTPPAIHVLAGTNGAGKSSVAGAAMRLAGADYFNPDEAARRILARNPGITIQRANSEAWLQGKRLLERAIDERASFAFETTLGGSTIPGLLGMACKAGIEVRIWYVGLEGVDLHIARVRARLTEGGHDIPEETIRARYRASRVNLVRLLPDLTELAVYDNSEEGNPALGVEPRPRLILQVVDGAIEELCDLEEVPQWAKPIIAAAIRLRGIP